MQRFPFSSLLQTALAILVLALAHSGFLFAQERPVTAFRTALGEPSAVEAPVATPEAPLANESPAPSDAATLPESSAFSTSASGMNAMEPAAFVSVTAPPKEKTQHRFWDNENRALFATVGGLAALDFYATHANLANGGRELNPVTRVFCGNTLLLATNFALETGGVVGISYLFHKTGHHKLERITALVNIGSSGAAAGYSLAHR